jgi:IS5 family transposase
LQSQLDGLGLKIKKEMIQYSTFMHSDPGHAKLAKPRKNKAKKKKLKRNLDKKNQR